MSSHKYKVISKKDGTVPVYAIILAFGNDLVNVIYDFGDYDYIVWKHKKQDNYAKEFNLFLREHPQWHQEKSMTIKEFLNAQLQ